MYIAVVTLLDPSVLWDHFFQHGCFLTLGIAETSNFLVQEGQGKLTLFSMKKIRAKYTFDGDDSMQILSIMKMP